MPPPGPGHRRFVIARATLIVFQRVAQMLGRGKGSATQGLAERRIRRFVIQDRLCRWLLSKLDVLKSRLSGVGDHVFQRVEIKGAGDDVIADDEAGCSVYI